MLKKKLPFISPAAALDESKTIGGNLSFAASEAYKLLRTNLLFSLPDNNKCRVVGITSSIQGEGKSTTAINLAYTIAETNKKVLLLEADLRRPSIARRLGINSTPGISNFLAGFNEFNEVLQSALLNNLKIITAGDIPPNPTELLDSSAMAQTVEKLAEVFDFIIIDLPPINLVSDALVAGKYVDGIVFIVRQNYNSRQSLDDAINQFKFINTKLLGFVMTGSEVKKKNYKKYGNKYGYYKHGQGYGYGYGYGYAPSGSGESGGKKTLLSRVKKALGIK